MSGDFASILSYEGPLGYSLLRYEDKPFLFKQENRSPSPSLLGASAWRNHTFSLSSWFFAVGLMHSYTQHSPLSFPQTQYDCTSYKHCSNMGFITDLRKTLLLKLAAHCCSDMYAFESERSNELGV